MVYKFRICENDDLADTAQGWVVAMSEIEARSILGRNSHLHLVGQNSELAIPNRTVFVTHGQLH